MARPERNDVDYFPFLCKEGKAMFYIDKKYKNDGYATWVKTLRALAVTNYHFLNLSEDAELMFHASKCNITEEVLLSILNDLVTLGEFDADFWQHRVIYNQKFNDSISDAYKKRGNKMMKKEELMQFLCDKGVIKEQKAYVNPQKVSVNPQSILKETKVKETKEKEIAATPLVYFDDDYILNLKYKEYLDFRKQIKKPLSEISIKANIESLKKLAKGDNDTAIKILDQSIANGWQGLFELKQSKETQSPQSRLEKFIAAPTRLDKFLENTDNNSNFTI